MNALSRSILNWYSKHKRSLPWRGEADAYAVWVSEIMLQQTRVDTVIPYYQRWMNQFPDVNSLAAARLQEILRLWEGLGYYGRARNMHWCAQIIVQSHAGVFPDSVQELQELPGIGAYTSRAIASIAFGKDFATLDSNIRRVLARLFDMQLPARSAAGEKRLWQLAQEILPTGHAGDHNQALMELGALVCLPRNPLCARCPLVRFCAAFKKQAVDRLPNLQKSPPVPHHIVTAAVIRRGARVLITQRPQDGLLGGMWEFPGGKLEPGETLQECLRREIREEIGADILVGSLLNTYRHAYTHFRITVHAFECRLNGSHPEAVAVADLRWVKPEESLDFPMGKVDRMISRDLNMLKSGRGYGHGL